MTQSSDERFYQLLPTLYRWRDQESGEPLRALMAVLESEFMALEADMQATYDNWFIQTCDAWAIPYIADLVGIRDMSQQKHIFSTQRRQVANTIGYRRRKGTLSVLEHVLRDVTGWAVYAAEYFADVATTQHMANPRPIHTSSVDLRCADALASREGPFNQLAHTADVRQLRRGPTDDDRHMPTGRYNLHNLGLFAWRLRSYTISGSFACPGPAARAQYGLYCFHPLGQAMQLFNRPQVIADISQRMDPAHLPIPLSRELFAADLAKYAERYQDRHASERPANSDYYGPGCGLSIADARGPQAPRPILPLELVSMDLSRWQDRSLYETLEAYRAQGKRVAIDVQLGRMAVLPPVELDAQPGAPAHWEKVGEEDFVVTYAYGFSSEIGGGSYHRSLGQAAASAWQIAVAKGTRVSTLQAALQEWDAYCAQNPGSSQGRIRILDNGVYDADLDLQLPLGASLAIIADNGVRPVLRARHQLQVVCAGEDGLAAQGRRLLLSGLLLAGPLCIHGQRRQLNSGRLEMAIEHCTLMPGAVTMAMGADEARMSSLRITHSIVGPLYLPATLAELSLVASIVDGQAAQVAIGGDSAGRLPGPPTRLERTTVFGRAHVAALTADEVIFTAPVIAADRGAPGRVSHSYLPAGSQTPLRIDCLPDDDAVLRPIFSSTRYGDPAYAQLSLSCPRQIRRGARDGAEIGAFHDLHQPQAEDNLRAALEEYLPVGLEAGIVYVT